MFSTKKEMRTKVKTVNGINYSFTNIADYEKFKFFIIQGEQFKNQIDFSGLEKYLHKEINKSDFEKKIDLANISSIQVDSVSFEVHLEKNKVDLIYYLNLDNHTKSVVFTLLNINDKWILN